MFLLLQNISYKHRKCQHCLKTFDGADVVVRHYVSDHPDKYVSLLWPLLNNKCPAINDIIRGRQDARGQRKGAGAGRHGQRGEKMEEEREGSGTKGGEREKRHNLHP